MIHSSHGHQDSIQTIIHIPELDQVSHKFQHSGHNILVKGDLSHKMMVKGLNLC